MSKVSKGQKGAGTCIGTLIKGSVEPLYYTPTNKKGEGTLTYMGINLGAVKEIKK